MPDAGAHLGSRAAGAHPLDRLPGFPQAPLLEAHDLVAALLRGAGVQRGATLSLPGTAPVITGEIPGPQGAPTVLLYAHYDVQPPGDKKLWRTPPFEPTEREGAIYGRGVADDKSNVKSVLVATLGSA